MQVYWQEYFSQGPNCEITHQPRFWAGFIVCRWHDLDNQHRMFPQTLSLGNLCRCNGCFPTWLGKGATFLTRRLSWGSPVPFFQADLDPQLLLFVVVYVFIVVCNGVRYKNGWNRNPRQFRIKSSFSRYVVKLRWLDQRGMYILEYSKLVCCFLVVCDSTWASSLFFFLQE